MKLSIFLLMTLLLNPVLVLTQNKSEEQQANDLHHKRTAITGCLTKNSLNEFELIDEEGTDNLPYTPTMDLNQYVGQFVTLTGTRAATHAVDSGVPPKPHFLVSKVQPASGKCKKSGE